MRLEESVDIKVDEKTTRTYTVFEVKPLDAVKIYEEGKGILDMVREILPMAADITIEDLKALYPSEQELLFDAFKRVNGPFLKAGTALGILEGMEGIRTLLLNEFKNSVVGSLKEDTPDPGNTESRSS